MPDYTDDFKEFVTNPPEEVMEELTQLNKDETYIHDRNPEVEIGSTCPVCKSPRDFHVREDGLASGIGCTTEGDDFYCSGHWSEN